MKWKTDLGSKRGEERYRTIFALTPKRCTDMTTRWLEWVRVKEKFEFEYVAFGACTLSWQPESYRSLDDKQSQVVSGKTEE